MNEKSMNDKNSEDVSSPDIPRDAEGEAIESFAFDNLVPLKYKVLNILYSFFFIGEIIKYIIILTDNERKTYAKVVIIVGSICNALGLLVPLFLNRWIFIWSEIILGIVFILLYNLNTDRYLKTRFKISEKNYEIEE